MQLEPSPELASFLRDLPKTETHLHIEGALPFRFLQESDAERYALPPASWAEDFRFRNFAHFEEELLGMVAAYHASPERYFASCQEVFRRLHDEERVRYVECSFASGILEFIGGDGAGNAEAIKKAAPEGLEVRVFLGIHHLGYNEQTASWIEESTQWEYLDGVDLHGPEDQPMGDGLPALWEAFRVAGKRTKAHAGEFLGPAFVRYALDELKVKRIEHGVRAIEDPELVERLVAEQVTLDVCPISNLKLGVVESLARHPIRALVDAGVPCTLSTDDPISFGNRLQDEYVVLANEVGFSIEELGVLAANGFRVADLGEGARRAHLQSVEGAVHRHT